MVRHLALKMLNCYLHINKDLISRGFFDNSIIKCYLLSASIMLNFSVQSTVASANKAPVVALTGVVAAAGAVLAFLDGLRELDKVLGVKDVELLSSYK